MNILMLVDSLDIGGTETYALAVAIGLSKKGHKVVVGTSGGPLMQKFRQAGLEIALLPFQDDNPLSTNYIDLLSQVRQIVRDHQIDLIHVHFIAGLKIAAQITQELLIPVVMTVHGMFYPWKKLQSLIDGCDHVIAVSPPVAKWVSKRIGYPKKQLTVIPNGIDFTHFSPAKGENDFRLELGIGLDDYLVTIVSRIAWGKTRVIEQAIQAVEELSESHKIRLAIVGSGPDSPFIHAMATMVNKRHDKDLVLLTGAMLDPIIAYDASDLIIGTGRVALEAMGCEKPVIAVGNSGYVGIMTPSNLTLGWERYFGDHDFVKAASAGQLKDHILEVMSSADNGENLKQLRKMVTKHFDISLVVDNIEDVYQHVLGHTKEIRTGGPTFQDDPDQEQVLVTPEPDQASVQPTVSTTPFTPFKMSLVSVVIPTYNRAKYLVSTLEGLLNQSYRPLEIVIVDDYSQDNTDQVVQDFLGKTKDSSGISVLYHKLPKNVGFAQAQSIGYALSRGDFIANHDSDDLSHPERIEQQVNFLMFNPDYQLVGTNYEVFTNDVATRTKSHLLRYDNNIIKSYREGNHCVCFGSILMRRQVIEKIGGLTTFMTGAEDYEFIARAIAQGFNVQNIRAVLYYYRQHDTQRSKEFYGLREQLTKHALEELQ